MSTPWTKITNVLNPEYKRRLTTTKVGISGRFLSLRTHCLHRDLVFSDRGTNAYRQTDKYIRLSYGYIEQRRAAFSRRQGYRTPSVVRTSTQDKLESWYIYPVNSNPIHRLGFSIVAVLYDDKPVNWFTIRRSML